MKTARMLALLCALAAVVGLAGCADLNKPNATTSAARKVERHAEQRSPYLPTHDVEFNNYNAAQKLYDDPSTIIWCSTTWGNASAPIVTVPIAGKLTSSTTSYFPSTKWTDRGHYSWTEVQQPSVDGMYHPNPPQYRYGFTPGGQYVDFFNMPTVCTTQPTKFQREKTSVVVSVDPGLSQAQAQASALLKQGKHGAAQRVLQNAMGGQG